MNDQERRDVADGVKEQNDFGMTDLEEQLRGPDGQDAAARTLHRLGAIDEDLAGRMRAGLSSDEFGTASSLKTALDAAKQVVVLAAGIRNSGV